MGTVVVVILQPEIEVGLQLLQRCVEGLAESRRVELILQGFVEALADAVGLGFQLQRIPTAPTVPLKSSIHSIR